jgi:hypothetical protein
MVVISWKKRKKEHFKKKKKGYQFDSTMMMMMILLNFSNDLVKFFFGKMPYRIDSLLGFSLYNEELYLP